MNNKSDVNHRLALLSGVELAPEDLAAVIAEVEDLPRIIAELEEFAQATPWISQQTEPAGKKVGS